MPMCIGSFSLHSKWIGLSKRDPNSSVLRRDVESDRLIGNKKCHTIHFEAFHTSLFGGKATKFKASQQNTVCELMIYNLNE